MGRRIAGYFFLSAAGAWVSWLGFNLFFDGPVEPGQAAVVKGLLISSWLACVGLDWSQGPEAEAGDERSRAV